MKLFRLIPFVVWVMPAIGQSASTIISKALNVLNPTGTVAQDVQLTGDVEYIAGSQDEKGTIRLLSNQEGMARTEISLPSGTVLETKRTDPTARGGEMQKGSVGIVSIGLGNLFVDPAWFFPEHLLSRQSANGRTVSLIQTGPSAVAGAIHLQSWLPAGVPASPYAAHVRRLSGMDFYIDPSSFVLDEVDFDTHPETNSSISIPIRIVFTDYRTVEGHLVPFHIQKYLNGTLNADITITSAVVNPGVSSSNYTLQ